MMKSTKAKRRERQIASVVNLFSCLPGKRQQRVLDAVMDMIAEHQEGSRRSRSARRSHPD